MGGDGIVVQMNTGALVEHNTVSDVANLPNGSNAAVWAWNADYTLFQYNEVFDTKRLPDNNDGNSFDADYGTTGTVFQYNYSHDNEGGMMLYCGCGGLATDITFRYNISENDGDRVQFVAGATEAAFYNNTIIAPEEANFVSTTSTPTAPRCSWRTTCSSRPRTSSTNPRSTRNETSSRGGTTRSQVT